MPKKSSKQNAYNRPRWPVHGLGREPKAHFAVSTPIVQTSNYQFRLDRRGVGVHESQERGPRDSRARIRSLRQPDATGMRAQTRRHRRRRARHAVLHRHERRHHDASGLHAAATATSSSPSDCYRQTRDFATNILAEFGLQVSIVDPTAAEIAKAIRPNTNIIFTESPTNPVPARARHSGGRQSRQTPRT